MGLVIISAMGIFMSVCSSYYLAVGGMLSQDVLMPFLRKIKKTDAGSDVLVLRAGIFLAALLSIATGYKAQNLEAFFRVSGVIAVSGGAACILAGLFWKRAGKAGALASFLAGGLFYAASGLVFRTGVSVSCLGAVLSSAFAIVVFSYFPQHTGRKGKKKKEPV